ncbi:uncharacterized protein [Arachis hypogaea]|uniref:uncharacterized protein n=1 Tax=Arachis hypogaea TaxID=3818 RepID=UPI003B2252FF
MGIISLGSPEIWMENILVFGYGSSNSNVSSSWSLDEEIKKGQRNRQVNSQYELQSMDQETPNSLAEPGKLEEARWVLGRVRAKSVDGQLQERRGDR